MQAEEILDQAKTFIRAEGEAVASVIDQLDASFVNTVRLVSSCAGRVLVSGAGTSGTIARRLAHLLSCCGTPSFFVHPADALHGFSAAVCPNDVVIALSKAGESTELNEFVRIAQQRGAKIISFTADPASALAGESDVVVATRTDTRAEGEGVFPFGSSLASAAVGDAVCLISRRLRGFEVTELQQTHPAGATAKLVGKRDRD